MKQLQVSRQVAAPAHEGAAAHGRAVPALGAVALRPRTSAAAWLLDGSGWTWLRPCSDLLALTLAAIVTLRWPGEPVPASAAWPIVAFPAITMAMLAARGMYRRRMRVRILDGVVPVVGSVSIAAISAALLDVYAFGGRLDSAVLGHAWLLGTATVGLFRITAVFAQRRARAAGRIGRPTLIVGAGLVGTRVARRLTSTPEYGLRPVGFVDAEPLDSEDPADRELPVLGAPQDIEWIAQLTGARHVVLAFTAAPDHALVPLVRRCEELGLEVSMVPRLFDSVNDRFQYEALGGTPLLALRATDPKGWQFALKHALDRCCGALALLAFAPMMLGVAAAIRITSRGPVIFRQRRIGRDGRSFDLLKFCTMEPVPVADGFIPRAGSAPGGVEGADRRTRVGRFLRRTSIDELPQLLNVVRGEMSLVGPRPERPEFVELFNRDVTRYDDRHRVRSGITGWAQVHGLRGQTSLTDRVEWDNYYIEHWSLGLDLKILALTALAVLHAVE
jgi:exopolysaccharide biosynthesis polyprenyl glycosylphosphotransferase